MIKTFPASLDKLYEMLSFIKTQASLAGFDEGVNSKIELACEEALVNIITYGYPANRGNIAITCSNPSQKGITIEIKDRGIPYNPLTNAKKFNPSLSLETRSLGGYGVFFILKLMDEVNYKREDSSNILTLTKFLNS
jgi:serine/threonine-protein kinase RsbW